MTKIEILNKYKKQKHNTYRECDVINAMEKYLESYKKDQALQLQQTGIIKSFYCNSEATLEKRCDKQCSWCNSYEMIME